MKKLIALICFIGIFGCDELSAGVSNSDVKIHKSVIQQEMSYYKDPRTDLCFAAWRRFYTADAIVHTVTNVPCTEKVEKLLQ